MKARDVNIAQTYDPAEKDDDEAAEEEDTCRKYRMTEAHIQVRGIINIAFPGDAYKKVREPLLEEVSKFFE